MPNILHDATLITPGAAGAQVLREHSLVFDGGVIVELLPAADAAPRVATGEFDEVIRGERRIVTPGFVNTHHHLYQSLTRCLPAVQDRCLFHWLLGLYERWQHLDFESVYIAAKTSLAELLSHGCTTTNDHFYMIPPGSDVAVEAVMRAADEVGLRIHLCRGAMTLGQSAGGLPPDRCVETDSAALRDCERVLDAYHDPAPHAMRRIDLAPCSPFNVTREFMRDTRDLARGRGVLLHTHLAETLDEEEFCRARYGVRPLEFLHQLDWLGSDVYLAHCVWLSDEEIELMRATDTAIAHCPTSNMRLGSGIAPLEALLAAGIRVGLGVDGSSSNDGGSILAEMKTAVLAARVRPAARLARTADRGSSHSAAAVDHAGAAQPGRTPDSLFPARRAFELATAGGAAVLGRAELGHLNPGAAADFAMFPMDTLALAGAAAHDPLAALVLCDASRAERVFVAGREVVRDGRLLTVDEEELAARLNELAARLG